LPQGEIIAREVADLAEAKQLLVEARPQVHVAAPDVVRQVVDDLEAGTGRQRRARQRHEVDVVDRVLAVAVDEVDEAAADALDARDVELHRPRAQRPRLGAELERAAPGEGGVADAKGHRAGRRSVGARELLPEARRLGVDDEVDVALAVQRDVLGAVAGDGREAHAIEQAPQQLRVRRRVFDELEAVGAHRVVGGHQQPSVWRR